MRSEVWAGGGRTWAGGSARAACTERTRNMPFMSVTLDVSKLSGWLNALADCRVEKKGVRCAARCGPGGGGAWAGGSTRAACTARGPSCDR